ncbi:HTH domain-containing protein [Nitratireductor kimnyeongensis]|uniref:HTH domain-containing protein n=1 Tax=Nitratireductor kimnyeongensis TaxID=430679 RepID=A0ABW0TCD2_9HYPH|nr:HTH domain-containing protein [Nitratireductor kimnyeongensis]QZZ36695.1 HTH domain-containing protein [Nitratireductor kimnyeongensis]
MDALITAAGRALAAGDPLGALNRIALRSDAPALALRGIAMAQLGDLDLAKALLRRAARAFSPREHRARARCVVAEAEIALVSRDLGWPEAALQRARETLERQGDTINAAYARYLSARHLLLIGRLDEAERELEVIDPDLLPLQAQAGCGMVAAGIAMRRVEARKARAALERAAAAARGAGIPALVSEVDTAMRALEVPAARLISSGGEELLLLDQVEALLASGTFVVDACRHVVRSAREVIGLETRPVLFALARALAEAWPSDVSRKVLVAKAFRGRVADESHRARLRVEIGRLRALLGDHAGLSATDAGFLLTVPEGRDVVVLAQPVEDSHADVLALLGDGEAWSSAALALALGVSSRTVQRALERLREEGKVRSFGRGRGRACRWVVPTLPGFPTNLLLPAKITDG